MMARLIAISVLFYKNPWDNFAKNEMHFLYKWRIFNIASSRITFFRGRRAFQRPWSTMVIPKHAYKWQKNLFLVHLEISSFGEQNHKSPAEYDEQGTLTLNIIATQPYASFRDASTSSSRGEAVGSPYDCNNQCWIIPVPFTRRYFHAYASFGWRGAFALYAR